MIDSDYNYNYL